MHTSTSNYRELLWRPRAILAALIALTLIAVCAQPKAHARGYGEWGPAVNLDPDRTIGINTPFNDGCPIEGPDGNLLFIATNRAGILDIWVSSRAKEGAPWTAPERLPSPVNQTGSNEFCPTPLPGNRLLFVSTRANLCGGAGNNPDLYETRLHPVQGWLEPRHLGCLVNSGAEEFSPSLVETDDRTILFFSSSRDDSPRHKIYMSVLQGDGTWGTATPVNELNMAGASDARPNVRKDGLEIVFDSTRGGGPPQIYSAKRSNIQAAWSTPELLGSNVNSPGFAQSRASISRDGKRLYFGSSRANQPGDQGSDVFVSTRSVPRQTPMLANISSRGVVTRGDDVLIGGFILDGAADSTVLVRAIGPSLSVGGALADPKLELFDGNGVSLMSNDNWRDTQETEILATGIPPPNDRESAIVHTFAPGAYTAIVRGVNNTTGIALVEVYAVP